MVELRPGPSLDPTPIDIAAEQRVPGIARPPGASAMSTDPDNPKRSGLPTLVSAVLATASHEPEPEPVEPRYRRPASRSSMHRCRSSRPRFAIRLDPFHFRNDEPQPFSRSPRIAQGSCSDAIQFKSFLESGQLVLGAQLGNPIVLDILPGMAFSYSLPDPLIGLATPAASGCRFQWGLPVGCDPGRARTDPPSGSSTMHRAR